MQLSGHSAAQQCVQADLVVRAALELLSRRGAFFRFAGWFSYQAANASRWAVSLGVIGSLYLAFEYYQVYNAVHRLLYSVYAV